MNQEQLIAFAKAAAEEHQIDLALVCALIEQESAWNPWTNRYEPDFEASPKYGPIVLASAHDFAATALTKHGYETTWQTEVKNRCTSWGPMQILGEDAREQGFTSPIPSLCDPGQGIPEGLVRLARCLREADGDAAAGLLRWNGGADKDYPAKVLERMHRYK